MRIFSNPLVLFLTLTLTVFSGINENTYVNESLALEWSKPLKSEKFLEGPSLDHVNRDALIGLVEPEQNFYSFLIVDQYGNLSVKEYAKILLDELPLEEKKVSSFEGGSHNGLPAMFLKFEGVASSHKVSYEIELIYYESFIYQQVSFLIHKNLTPPSIEKLKPSLKILKNFKPRPKVQETSNPGFSQVWIREKDRFYHLGTRVKLSTSIKGFRSLHGEEARYFHPSAEFAYEDIKGKHVLYALFASGLSSSKELIDMWKHGFSNPSSLVQKKDLDGMKVFEMKAEKSGETLRYLLKLYEKDQNRILLVLFQRQFEESLFPMDILRGIQWMTKKEQKEIRNLLKERKYKVLLLGDQQSYFENIYRNFPMNLELKLPAEDLVDAYISQNVGLDVAAEFQFQNYTMGYNASLQMYEEQFSKPLEHHMKFFHSRPHAKNKETMQQGDVYFTRFSLDGQAYEYILISGKNHENYFDLLVWGIKLPETKDLVSLVHWKKLVPYSKTKSSFVHNRLGFDLAIPDKETLRVDTSPDLAPIGEELELVSPKGTYRFVVAHSYLVDQDLLLDLFSQGRAMQVDLIPGQVSEEEFLGMKVSVREFRLVAAQGPKFLIQKTFRRGETIFSLLCLFQEKPGLVPFFEEHKLRLSREEIQNLGALKKIKEKGKGPTQ